VFQARYVFGQLSLASFLGGLPVGMGIDIVTMGVYAVDIEVAMFTVLVNLTNTFYSQYPGSI